MNIPSVKHWLKLTVILVALSWMAHAQATTPASWKSTGFSINANGMSLREVLEQFGLAYGVRVSNTIKEDTFLHSRIKADSGSIFLDRLARTHQFRWFVYNDVLHVSPATDNTSVRLEVGEDAVQDAKSALVGLGLFESHFGWGELPDEGIVVVSGPRQYTNLVREVLLPEGDPKKSSVKGKQIMVFRLKYASAMDRVIHTRGEKETVPGIKTILNGLLNNSSVTGQLIKNEPQFDVGSGKRSRQGHKGKGVARELGDTNESQGDSERDDETGRSSRSKNTSRDERPSIDADPALNAIMIYDQGSKREMYKALIAELDTEPQQVEIEALIVDIERSKLTDLGVEWGVQRSNGTTARMNSTRADSQGTNLPIPGATLVISNAARFYARLKALEGTGEARVLAKPTVLTLDNVAAILDLSETTYVPLVGERVADIANITAGTKLRVVPRIVREATGTRVRLEVDIEDGSLGEVNAKTNVTRSTISTQAIIDLQQTLMIGGYHAEKKMHDHQKVPVLGDVPLFGNLFRSTSESYSNRERLFLITPRLSGTTGIPAPVLSKAARLAAPVVVEDNWEHVDAPKVIEPARDAPPKKDPANVPQALQNSGSQPEKKRESLTLSTSLRLSN